MNPPDLKLTLAERQSADGDALGYQLHGWDEFDQWAHHNVDSWHAMRDLAQVYQITELDRARIMAWTYLKEMRRVQDEYAEYQWKNPKPVMGPNGEVWRYVGP
jgi:hypothetical protein